MGGVIIESLISGLLEFFILDCALEEPALIKIDGSMVCSQDKGTKLQLAIGRKELEDKLLGLKDAGLIAIDSIDGLGKPFCDYLIELTPIGGNKWSKLAIPQWDRYTRVSAERGGMFSLVAKNQEALLRRAYEVVRFSQMSFEAADRFMLHCPNRIETVVGKLLHWSEDSELFRLVILDADIDPDRDEMDSQQFHLEWFGRMIRSQKWCEYGFLERYAEEPLVERTGMLRRNTIDKWANSQRGM